MLTLIVGGAASGKSEFAERLVTRLPGERIYIATMEPFDDECRARIARHRAMRKQRSFDTVECYVDLPGLVLPAGSNALLEDLTNLVANERYSAAGTGVEAVRRGVERLNQQCGNLTIVTGEVFSGGSEYEGDTLGYLQDLAWVNREVAAMADLVVEVVCGVANVLKGALI